jgi:hypothetical protein
MSSDDESDHRLTREMSDDMVPNIGEEDKAMSTLGSQSAFLSMLNMGM